MNTVLRKISVVGLLALGLSACSSEPSETQMGEALERGFKGQIEGIRAKMMAANNPDFRDAIPVFAGLHSFRKLTCAPAPAKPGGEPGYICGYEIDIMKTLVSRMFPESGIREYKGRFSKGVDGWQYEGSS